MSARTPQLPQAQASAPRPSLNLDPSGKDLTITIRLAPDGRVFFHDITIDLEPVAAAMTQSNLSRTHA